MNYVMLNVFERRLMVSSQTEIDYIYKIANKLKHGKDVNNFITSNIDFKNMKMGAYDEAILDYCNSILLYNCSHSKTEWVQKVQDLVCIGRLDKNESLNKKAIERRMKNIPPWDRNTPSSSILRRCELTPKKWIFYRSAEREPAPFTIFGNVKFYTKQLLKSLGICKKDRVLGIIQSIEHQGLLLDKFYETDTPVLARLHEMNIYIAITGRHRIAALRYLAKHNNMQFDSLKIPILDVESDHFALSEKI